MRTPVLVLLEAVTLRCCSGHERMAVHGIRKLVPMLLGEVISKCCNGYVLMVAPRIGGLVPLLLNMIISTCCNGPSQTVVHTIESSCAAKQCERVACCRCIEIVEQNNERVLISHLVGLGINEEIDGHSIQVRSGEPN